MKRLAYALYKIVQALLNLIAPIITWPIRIVLHRPNVIILQTYSPFRYGGNPRYLFEYLSKNTQYSVYWVTESEDIRRYLSEQGYRYISSTRFWERFVIAWSAQVVIDSGTSYFNYLNLVPKRAVKICTMHGSGPKLTMHRHRELRRTTHFIKQAHRFDYYSFCTERAKTMLGRNQFLLHSEKMLLLGAPKCDQFYDEKLVTESRLQRRSLNTIVSDLDPEARVIYYIPTYRPYPCQLPLLHLDGFDERMFRMYLEKRNLYFMYSVHSMSAFTKHLESEGRIIYFGFEEHPLVDNNQLLMEADVIVGDYSQLATDVAIMRKPQIFVMPDYDTMDHEKGFAEDMRPLIPGPEATSYAELVGYMDEYLDRPESYRKGYDSRIDLLLNCYMDPTLTNSCERFREFIDGQMK